MNDQDVEKTILTVAELIAKANADADKEVADFFEKAAAYRTEAEATLTLAATLAVAQPDVFRWIYDTADEGPSTPDVNLPQRGSNKIAGIIIRATITTDFTQLEPALKRLDDEGWKVEHDSDMYDCRRFQATHEGMTPLWIIASLKDGSACKMVERQVTKTEYEIECPGEGELVGTAQDA